MVNSGALAWCAVPAPLMATVMLIYLHTRNVMNAERDIMVNPDMMATLQPRNWWLQYEPWFRSFLVSSNNLSIKSWHEPQALEYRINWYIYIYTPYVGAAGMLLHINEKLKIGIFSFVVKFRSWTPLTVNFDVHINVWSRYICSCGILYFKLYKIDAINEITKLKQFSQRTSSR